MTWKKVNQSDAGTGSKFGGNDIDKISDAFSGTDVDDIDMNCDFTARDNKLHYRNPANTFSYNIRTSAIGANRDVTEPLLTANDTRVYQAHAQTLTNKTIDTRDNPIITRENSYLIFKDGSTYYARNGTTGALTSNTAFSTVLQGIIDSIATRDDTVRTKIKIAPGDYDVNTVITITDKYNVVIEGSGRGITHIRAGASLSSTALIIDIKGSVSGTGKNLTVNTAKKDKSVTMSSGDASTFAAGDIVLVRSNVDFATGGSASGHQGEIKTVLSSAAGVVTFTEPLYDVYLTASTANVIKLLPSKKITFKNFTLSKNPSFVEGDSSKVIRFTFCDQVVISGLEMIDMHGQFANGGINFISATNVEVSECHLQLSGAYNFQYGLSFECACQNCVVVNCTANGNFRHAFEAGSGKTGTNEEGACRNIVFTGCTNIGGGSGVNTGPVAFDTHPESEFIIFDSCQVLGTNGAGAFKLRGRYSKVTNCTARNASQTSNEDVIRVSDFASSCSIIGNHILDCTGKGIGINDGLDGTIIEGNYIENCTSDGIYTDSGSSRTMIIGNEIRNNGSDGMDLLNFDDSVITNNIITGNTSFGIRFESGTCTNNLICNNWFGSNGSGAVQNGGQSGSVEANNKGYP